MATVPVIELAGLSEAEKRAYILADNKIALNAGWDTETLALEIGELGELGFDLSLTGFGDEEIATLLNSGNSGLTDPDAIPETPAEPVTQMGDAWLLGRHRLVCGDATRIVATTIGSMSRLRTVSARGRPAIGLAAGTRRRSGRFPIGGTPPAMAPRSRSNA